MNEYERYGDYSQQSPEASGGRGTGTALTFLLIGMGVGAAAALLFTPISGSELRGNISRGYRSTLDGISQGTQRLREHGSNLLGFNRRRGNREEKQYQQQA
jgi:gas vesicle protein